MLRDILTHGNRLDMHGAGDGSRLRRWGQSKVEPNAESNSTYKSRFEKGVANGLSGYVEQTHVVCSWFGDDDV